MFARNGGVMRRTSITIAQRRTLPSALVPEDSDNPVPSALEPDGFAPAIPPAGPAVLGPRVSGTLGPAGLGALVAGPDSRLEPEVMAGFVAAGPLSRADPGFGFSPAPASPTSRLLEPA